MQESFSVDASEAMKELTILCDNLDNKSNVGMWKRFLENNIFLQETVDTKALDRAVSYFEKEDDIQIHVWRTVYSTVKKYVNQNQEVQEIFIRLEKMYLDKEAAYDKTTNRKRTGWFNNPLSKSDKIALIIVIMIAVIAGTYFSIEDNKKVQEMNKQLESIYEKYSIDE